MGNSKSLVSQLKQSIRSVKNSVALERWFSGQPIRQSNQNDKESRVQHLYAKVKNCTLCEISKTKTNVVFGEGSVNAELVFIGEAPGRDEDLSGRPFVGVAGQLLSRIIQAMGFKRQDVYITNILRCRPPQNRNPNPQEICNCRPYLLALLKIIKPKVICALGKFAATTLLDDPGPISKLRGKFFEFEGMKLLPTYHPAYLLRNPQDKKLAWQDMQKIMKVLGGHETRKTG